LKWHKNKRVAYWCMMAKRLCYANPIINNLVA
jgi:hypothetical protein